MGVEGVAAPGDVQPVLKSFTRRRLDHAGVEGMGLLQAHAVFACQRLLEVALLGGVGVGVELEAAEFDLDIAAMIEPLEGALEAPLAM